jgi:hypothetical protein
MVQDKTKEIAGRRRIPLLARVTFPACHLYQHLGFPPGGSMTWDQHQGTKSEKNTEKKRSPENQSTDNKKSSLCSRHLLVRCS